VDVAICEADIFTLLILNPVRRPGYGVTASPTERHNPAAFITAKFYSRFDRIGNRSAGASDELSTVGREQGANLSGFVKRDKVILPSELTPHLKVDEVIWSPLIRANIFAERLIID
jgi:hypothetical protein